MSRARAAFHLDVPVRSLLEAPTVTDMAVLIALEQAGRMEPETIDRMLSELDGPDT